ncbi:hypothetical protein [Streptomyces xantholiticus]|uniref:Uncharacterized protein n=1 Tax=Streptomyces xantholiticus TaxID=68285 RepID=A0ABV1V3G5_9ACTN
MAATSAAAFPARWKTMFTTNWAPQYQHLDVEAPTPTAQHHAHQSEDREQGGEPSPSGKPPTR